MERIRASKKAWVDRNFVYVRAQIRALQARPEYLAKRREIERAMRRADPKPRGRPPKAREALDI